MSNANMFAVLDDSYVAPQEQKAEAKKPATPKVEQKQEFVPDQLTDAELARLEAIATDNAQYADYWNNTYAKKVETLHVEKLSTYQAALALLSKISFLWKIFNGKNDDLAESAEAELKGLVEHSLDEMAKTIVDTYKRGLDHDAVHTNWFIRTNKDTFIPGYHLTRDEAHFVSDIRRTSAWTFAKQMRVQFDEMMNQLFNRRLNRANPPTLARPEELPKQEKKVVKGKKSTSNEVPRGYTVPEEALWGNIADETMIGMVYSVMDTYNQFLGVDINLGPYYSYANSFRRKFHEKRPFKPKNGEVRR